MYSKIMIVALGLSAISGCVTNDDQDAHGNVVANGACPPQLPPSLTCELDANQIHIAGRSTSKEAPPFELAISLFNQSLLVENLRLSALSIHAIGCDCQINISDVKLDGTATGRHGIMVNVVPRDGSEAEVAMEKITLAGFDRAITTTHVHSLSFRDVTVDCRRVGISATETQVTQATEVRVSGCDEEAFFLTNTNSLALADSQFDNNAVGVRMRGSDYQVAVTGQRVSFESNGLALRADNAVLRVTNLRVANNGVPADYLETSDLGGPGGIFVVVGEGSVHDSSFTGNAGIALELRTGSIDAQENWWGSAQGPRIHTAAGPIPPVGDGNVVTTNVDFVPFRQQPPR